MPRNLALSCAAALAAALLTVAAAAQEPVKLAEGRISFVPPEGFKPMSREDVLFKFGRRGEAGAPELVYSNERQSVSVAVGFNGQNVPADRLPQVKEILEADFARSLPGLEWRTREIVERNGTSWIHLQMKAPAVDTQVISDMYITVFDGRLLIFNFNSTVALYDAHKESLEKSARTITVKK
jgi:hypothetical protein